eukprot:gene17091-20498_t
MSSHHIVKEKQEPALYIHQLADFEEEYLGQLLEWSPTVLVNAGEYEKVISLGLKVDVVVHEPETYLMQENTKIIRGPGDEFNTVMNYLIQEKYPAVNVISRENKLADLSYYIPQINVVLFTETEKAYAIKNGFKIWKPAGSIYHIEVSAYFETSNLKQKESGDFEVIADAKEQDISAIRAIAQITWGPTYVPLIGQQQVDYMLEKMYNDGVLQEQFLHGYIFLMAEINKKDVGFASYSLTDPEQGIYKLHKLEGGRWKVIGVECEPGKQCEGFL